MARRHRKSPAEGFIELASRLPWWAALVLALVSHLVLRVVASEPVAAQPLVPGQMGAVVIATFGRTAAQFGQYLLPLAFVLAAGLSFFRSKKRAELLASATGTDAASRVSQMSWREFEILVGEGFRQRGYAVKDMGGQGPDGGIDLVLTQGKERFLVQCKQWRATKVSVTVVRELYGVMSAQGAAGGFVVTSGSFTDDAKDFASGRNIHLVDGRALLPLLDAAKPLRPQTPAPASLTEEPSQKLMPVCPKCGADMKVREAKQGAAAGSKFWGCSRYPGCRGTLSL